MDDNILKKIKAYLAGELSGAQHDKVRARIGEDHDDPKVVEALHEFWSQLPEGENIPRSRAAFGRFSRTIGGFPTAENPGKPQKQLFIRYASSIAAVLAVPLLLANIFLWSDRAVHELNYLEFSVPQGRKDSIRLPDNTVVWLNSGSRIVYPEQFGRTTRKVFLAGEAYFNVAKDPRKPFVLAMGDVNVRVLGTQFNATSYEDMQSVTVSLLEGSVAMDAEHNTVVHSTILVPGDVIRYDKTTGNFERTLFSTDAYCSWRSGGFYFHNQPLSEITAQFERVFDVNIFIHDTELRNTCYSLAFVNKESLEQMLEAINLDGKMNITRDKDMILITLK